MPKGLQTASEETKARVSRAGGQARAASMPALARDGARAAHSPATLARRIGRRWPELTPAERNEVLWVLRECGVIE